MKSLYVFAVFLLGSMVAVSQAEARSAEELANTNKLYVTKTMKVALGVAHSQMGGQHSGFAPERLWMMGGSLPRQPLNVEIVMSSLVKGEQMNCQMQLSSKEVVQGKSTVEIHLNGDVHKLAQKVIRGQGVALRILGKDIKSCQRMKTSSISLKDKVIVDPKVRLANLSQGMAGMASNQIAPNRGLVRFETEGFVFPAQYIFKLDAKHLMCVHAMEKALDSDALVVVHFKKGYEKLPTSIGSDMIERCEVRANPLNKVRQGIVPQPVPMCKKADGSIGHCESL